MASRHRRRHENVDGALFVDETCIDCDTCRWLAPATFDRAGTASRVHRQPEGPDELLAAHMALLACPTGSIGSDEKLTGLSDAVASFPAPLEGEAGPVYHCGWHAEASFGATAWLIVREEGNVLVDSPRFAHQLVERLEELGGVHTIFLTHKDDVADHEKFARHFGARRVMHAADIGPGTRDIEVPIEGSDDVPLAPGLTIIPTPGHTAGSCSLLLDGGYLFSGDHVAWGHEQQRLVAFERFCQYDWDVQRESMERLADRNLRWILPGHGRRLHLPADQMRQALAACAEWMGTVRVA